MSEYTPDTASVKACYLASANVPPHKFATAYIDHLEAHGPEFDRWLAAHDAAVRAQALRDAVDDWQLSDWVDAPRRKDRAQERIASAQYVADWLRDRADRIANGGGG